MAAAMVVPRYASQVAAPAPAAAPAPRVATASRAAPASIAQGRVSNYARSVVVPRDARGHFQVDAQVDGGRLSFMVDTGASVIALTASDAARLGHILGKYAGELERECLGLAAAGPRQDDAMPLRLVSRPLALIAAELFCQP